MNDAKLNAVMEALSRIESMLDDTDVKSSQAMKDAHGEESTEDAPSEDDSTSMSTGMDPEVDAPSSEDMPADGEDEGNGDDEGLEDELSKLADMNHPGAAGAMDFFAKDKKKPEEEE